MHKDPHNSIIQLLEEVKKGTFSFVGPLIEGGTPTIRTFLDGINAASEVLGVHLIPYSSEVYENIVTSRGWEYSNIGIWNEMRSRGMSEQEIAIELLEIEITLWKLSRP